MRSPPGRRFARVALAGPLHPAGVPRSRPSPRPRCAAPGTPQSPCSVATCRVPGTGLPRPPKTSHCQKTHPGGRASSGRAGLGSPRAGARCGSRGFPAGCGQRRSGAAPRPRAETPGRDPPLEAAAAAAAGPERLPPAEHSSLSERLNSSAGRNCPEPQANPVTKLVNPLTFPFHCFTRYLVEYLCQ